MQTLLTPLRILSIFMLTSSLPLVALPAKKDQTKIKGAMQTIYREMSYLLPLSLDDSSFYSKEREKKIMGSLLELSKVSNDVFNEKSFNDAFLNVTGKDFSYLSLEASKAFKEGHKPKAQALIRFQSEACMSCHTMQTSAREPRLQLDFLNKIEYEQLGTWEKARFLTMARQFSAAMGEYERLLSSKDLPDEEKVLSNAYTEYLILGLRVTGNLDRVQSFLSKVKKKEEPKVLQESFANWERSIKVIKSLKKPWDFETAKNLIRLGSKKNTYPADPQGVIYYIVASRILRESLASGQNFTAEKLSEHHFLLGKSELVVDIFGFKSMIYFAKAIKAAPKSKVAKEALKLYKENLFLNYSGSSGTHVPDDEMGKLKELTDIVKI